LQQVLAFEENVSFEAPPNLLIKIAKVGLQYFNIWQRHPEQGGQDTIEGK
jgi:hypothetical protein